MYSINSLKLDINLLFNLCKHVECWVEKTRNLRTTQSIYNENIRVISQFTQSMNKYRDTYFSNLPEALTSAESNDARNTMFNLLRRALRVSSKVRRDLIKKNFCISVDESCIVSCSPPENNKIIPTECEMAILHRFLNSGVYFLSPVEKKQIERITTYLNYPASELHKLDIPKQRNELEVSENPLLVSEQAEPQVEIAGSIQEVSTSEAIGAQELFETLLTSEHETVGIGGLPVLSRPTSVTPSEIAVGYAIAETFRRHRHEGESTSSATTLDIEAPLQLPSTNSPLGEAPAIEPFVQTPSSSPSLSNSQSESIEDFLKVTPTHSPRVAASCIEPSNSSAFTISSNEPLTPIKFSGHVFYNFSIKNHAIRLGPKITLHPFNHKSIHMMVQIEAKKPKKVNTWCTEFEIDYKWICTKLYINKNIRSMHIECNRNLNNNFSIHLGTETKNPIKNMYVSIEKNIDTKIVTKYTLDKSYFLNNKKINIHVQDTVCCENSSSQQQTSNETIKDETWPENWMLEQNQLNEKINSDEYNIKTLQSVDSRSKQFASIGPMPILNDKYSSVCFNSMLILGLGFVCISKIYNFFKKK